MIIHNLKRKLVSMIKKLKKELKTLIKTWDKYTKDLRIFLFVDDIDRYSEKKIIQSIDS